MVNPMPESPAVILRFLIIWLFLPVSAVNAATISVKTDRDPVLQNESFMILFESEGSLDDDPDFAPLEQDFQILSRQNSTNMSIMNGRISNTHTWQLMVLARRTGRLTIPSISFGKDTSPVTSITVESAPSPGTQQAATQGVFLEVEVNTPQPYVQAQVIYKVRLFLSVAVSNATLTEPEVPGAAAVIQKLGEDSRYQTSRNGKRYDVIERSYAIFPQTSGSMNVEPVVFQAQMASRSGFFSNPFDSGGRNIFVQSERVTMDVQPIPSGFSGSNWLPATGVELSESWSEEPSQFTVGQPITRTLTLSADSQTASQLPEMPDWDLPTLRQYPDMPSLNDQVTSTGIIGHRTERLAIIPNQPGEYVIPAITLPWWNTQTRQQEYARLPERRIVVLPTAQDSLSETPKAAAPVPAASPSPADPGAAPGSAPDYWRWLSLILSILWLSTLLLWWYATRKRAQVTPQPTSDSLRQVTRELQQACRDNDAVRARMLLLQWGRYMWPENPPSGATAIADRCNTELAAAIRELNAALYARDSHDWNSKALLRLVEEQPRRSPASPTVTGGLEPLHRI